VDRYPNVKVIEQHVDESLEAAETYGLFATPAIVVDRRAILYGVPTFARLAARCRATEAAAGDNQRPETQPDREAPSAGLTTAP